MAREDALPRESVNCVIAGTISIEALRKVQERRELPTRVTQRVQLLVQDNVITRVLASSGSMKPPLVFRVLGAIPFLRRIPARMVGLGFRRKHVAKYVTDPKGA